MNFDQAQAVFEERLHAPARHARCKDLAADCLEAKMVDRSDRRRSTQERLEAAQDAFVIALRRLRALEELAAQVKRPLDLEHAHALWARLGAHETSLEPGDSTARPDLDQELGLARQTFQQLRAALRMAEAAAALAA